MPSFRSGRDQAKHVVKHLRAIGQARHNKRNDGQIHSLGTARAYQQALTTLSRWISGNRLGDLSCLDQATALRYLSERAEIVRQPTLDQDRQAIQALLGVRLPRISSELSSALSGRAYTGDQLAAIAAAQSERHALATELAAACGLRAHELHTLRRTDEQTPSQHRTWRPDLHAGRAGRQYVVTGKGGLRRSVLVPADLVERLETRRLDRDRIMLDRGIRYVSRYDIGGGQAWSSSFSAASQRVLGWSNGAHGCRHGYAQNRMEELQGAGYTYEQALAVVSQEMGHFRSSITEVYLR